MAIAHVASGQATGSTGTTSITIPAGAAAGTLILLSATQSGSTTQTFTPPAGYTSIVSGTGGGTATGKSQAWYKVSVGAADQGSKSVSSTVTTGETRLTYEILSGTGLTVNAAGATPTASGGGTMSTTTLSSPSITTSVANAWYVGYVSDGSGGQHTWVGTVTEQLDSVSTISVTIGTEAIASASTTGTRACTSAGTTSSWVSLAFSVHEVAATATLTQTTFRGRNDDGNETTATWKATAGTDWTQAVDTNFRVRFNVNATTAAPTQNTAFVLRYSLNGGAYTAVSASSTVVRASASANLADGAATTEQLAGAGTFNAGTFDEVDGSATGFTAATASGQDTEVEYSTQIRSADVANNDTVNLRLYDNAGAVLNGGYTDTPIITVSEAAPPASAPPLRISPVIRNLIMR